MGAPVYYQKNTSLWVSNAAKDWFCDVVAKGADLKGIDLPKIFEEEPAIAGCYGISGLGIDMESFFKYFKNKEGFISHLEYCKANASDICEDAHTAKTLIHMLSWAIHVLSGRDVNEEVNIYETLPE